MTDINHAFNVAWFYALDSPGVPGQGPKFAGATAVSYVDGIYLERLPFGGKPSGIAAPCAALFWSVQGWSPDGRIAAYVTEVPTHQMQLRFVSGGVDRPGAVVEPSPTGNGQTYCGGVLPDDLCDLSLQFSPNGKYISYVQSLWAPELLRIWSSAGQLLLWRDTAMVNQSAWLGDRFYFRDEKGVEVWAPDQGVSLLLPGLNWIRPKASPDGAHIVYETRESSGLGHVMLLDAQTLAIRELAKQRSEPAFLSSRYIWYQEERSCQSACGARGFTPDGKAYVYDLVDRTETPSPIGFVYDVWPHGG